METKIYNFEDTPIAQDVFYGGNAGAKEAIIHDNSIWMIKYPKTTRDMINPQISYTTSPLSEYLGSKIYELMGHPVHEVLLGVRKGKLVVACKDFTRIPDAFFAGLIPFHDLKNSFMSTDLDKYSGTGSETFLDEVLATINGEKTLQKIEGTLERFWDMFVIDAFIGNNDRNNGNWGVFKPWMKGTIQTTSNQIINLSGELSLAPIYDNGNAFFNKRSLKQMSVRLIDEVLMQDDAYKTPRCVYKYSAIEHEGSIINPFKFISDNQNVDCYAAVIRFLAQVDMKKIAELINGIPEAHGVIGVMPDVQKEFYLRLLEMRLEKLREVVE